MRTIHRFCSLSTLFVFVSAGHFCAIAADDVSIDDLIASLSSDDPFESAKAATSLGERKPTTPKAIDALVKALSDRRVADHIPRFVPGPHRTVAVFVVDALVAIGKPAVDSLAKCVVGADDRMARVLALKTLRRLGQTARASAPSILRALNDDAEQIRFRAVYALAAVQPNDTMTVAALQPVLSDKSPQVRAAAIQLLGNMGKLAARTVPHIVKLLDDRADRAHYYAPDFAGTRPLRYDAAIALAEIGDAAKAALPKLQKMMVDDDDHLVRIASAFAVARSIDNPAPALAVLVKYLNDRQLGTEPTAEAARLLGKLGTTAAPAIPALSNALKHPDALVRINAATAIADIDPSLAETKLLPLLKDRDSLVRASVIETFGDLGLTSKKVIAALISALDDRDDLFGAYIRQMAAAALGKAGSNAAAALPRLRAMSKKDESDSAREAATQAIQKIAEDRKK